MNLPIVCLLTCTSGRHKCIERSVGLFLDQDYEGEAYQIIFNNSEVPQEWGKKIEIPPNRYIILINAPHNEKRDKWSTLGEIYNEAIKHIPPVCEVVSHLDDDDIILPNHITEGVNGYLRAYEQYKLAYKPAKSYYRSSEGISLVSNTIEPSIFIDKETLKSQGYFNTTSDQHLKWVNYLVENQKILVDEDGISTLIYNWGDNFPTYKTSGDPHNPNNFNNYRSYSTDHGDRIITPIKKEILQQYYNQINNGKQS